MMEYDAMSILFLKKQEVEQKKGFFGPFGAILGVRVRFKNIFETYLCSPGPSPAFGRPWAKKTLEAPKTCSAF